LNPRYLLIPSELCLDLEAHLEHRAGGGVLSSLELSAQLLSRLKIAMQDSLSGFARPDDQPDLY